MKLIVDADRVLADLRELAELTGGPDGARRLAWSPDWQTARTWLRGKLDELPVTVEQDVAGNLWAELPGEWRDAGLRHRRLAHRRGSGGRLAGRRARRLRRARGPARGGGR